MATSNLVKRTTETDAQGHTTVTLEYVVDGLSPGATDATVLSTTGIPASMAAFSGSGGAVAYKRSVEIKGETNPTANVTISYSTKPSDISPNGSEPDDDRDPTTDPPKIYGRLMHATEQRYRDAKGKEYKNTADCLIDPLPEIDRPTPVVIYEKKSATLNIITAAGYAGKINESDFTLTSQGTTLTIGKRTGLFLDMNCEPDFYTDSSGVVRPFWRERYEIAIKPSGWNPTNRDSYGYAEKVPKKNKPNEFETMPIMVRDAPISHMVPLDAAGRRAARPAVMTFYDYEEADFNWIGS